MRIQLAGLSGSFMGRAFDFPRQPVVTLGRNPQNNVAADPPREPMVSDKHAEIYEERGGIFIRDLNSTNGTYINGQRIALPTLLMPGMTLRLGGAGPELQILTLALEQGAPGMGQPAGFGAPQPQPWGAPPAPSPYPAPQTPQPAHAGAHPHGMDLAMPGLNAPPPYPVGGAKQGIGLMTLQREISNAKAEVRFEEGKKRRTALVVLSMVLLVGMIISVVVWAVIGSKIEANFQQVFEQHKHSIYLIYTGYSYTVEDPNTHQPVEKFSGELGTAFVINKEKGLLGTNAHMTEAVKSAFTHQSHVALVICNSKAECKYTIKKVISHPGYKVKMPDQISDTPDVGIIEADLNTDKGLVPMPDELQLASVEELKLETGQKIASMGFPGIEQYQQQYIRTTNKGVDFEGVVAKFSEGKVSNVLSFTYKPWPANDNANFEILEHTIPTFGGCSGSPIFNTNGRVVALHNSAPHEEITVGNEKHTFGRGLQAWGINVKFLKELVDKEYPGAWH